MTARTTKAYRDGYDCGRNAAGWWIQENGGGRDTRATDWVADFLRKLDDGDCLALDSVACPVNLSGEWAGGPTVEDVADLYSRRPSPDALDALCAELAAARADAEFLRGTVLRICALLPDAADMLAGDAFDKDKRRVVARRVMADCLNRVHDEVAEAIAVQRARVAGVQS